MTKLEKTEKPGLYRDKITGAILNTDLNSLQAYKIRKQRQEELNKKQEKMEREIAEIKEMLRYAIEKAKC